MGFLTLKEIRLFSTFVSHFLTKKGYMSEGKLKRKVKAKGEKMQKASVGKGFRAFDLRLKP